MLISYDEGASDESLGLIKGLEKGAGKGKQGERVQFARVTDSYVSFTPPFLLPWPFFNIMKK